MIKRKDPETESRTLQGMSGGAKIKCIAKFETKSISIRYIRRFFCFKHISSAQLNNVEPTPLYVIRKTRTEQYKGVSVMTNEKDIKPQDNQRTS